MQEIKRINPADAHRKIISGIALLVCAYKDNELFSKMHLNGALSYADFSALPPALAKDQEIIFYCG